MNLDIFADKPALRANLKPAAPKKSAKKSAAKKQPKTLYDVAIANGWGPRLKGLNRSIAHLKSTPA